MNRTNWINVAVLGVLLYQGCLPLTIVQADEHAPPKEETATPLNSEQNQRLTKSTAGDALNQDVVVQAISKTPKTSDVQWQFDHNTGVLEITGGTLGTTEETYQAPWLNDPQGPASKTAVKAIEFTGEVKGTGSLAGLFDGYEQVERIDFNDAFDTSDVTNLAKLFQNCKRLTQLDLGTRFDTSQVENMDWMFAYCSGLTSLNLGEKFDTSQVQNMQMMFYACISLTSLDLGTKFDTSNVQNMERMFYDCSSLTSLDLGEKFDTSNVQNMERMFYDCSSLTSLDLGEKFDTSQVENMDWMFASCSGLTSLDLGEKFDTSQVENMVRMFYDCSGLTSLNLGTKFDTSQVKNAGMRNMFSGCNKLSKLTVGTGFEFKVNHEFSLNGKTWHLDGPGSSSFTNITALTTYQNSNKGQPNTYFANHIVTFDAQGGTPSSSEVADSAGTSTVPLPADPTKAGYTFKGWFTEKTGGTHQTDPLQNVTQDHTFYAHWAIDEQALARAITLPADQEYNGQAVRSTLDKSSLHASLYPKIVTTYEQSPPSSPQETAPRDVGDYRVKVILKQEPPESDRLITQGDFAITPKILTITGVTAVNRVVNATTDVTLIGGTLQGVLANERVGVKLGTGTIPLANQVGTFPVTTAIQLTGKDAGNYQLDQPTDITVTITARPTQQVQVTFETDGHGTLEGATQVKVKRGSTLATIPVPRPNAGYAFSHWEKAGQPVEQLTNEVITSDVTYRAIFRPVTTHTVRFTTDGHGTLLGNSEISVATGETLTDIPQPVANDGYLFSRWVNEAGETVGLEQEVITKNTTYQALFRKVDDVVKTIPLYRVYNPHSGEHFYTLHAGEKDQLIQAGWQAEGIAGQQPEKGEAVYRLYNPNAGDHHYTPSQAERDHLTAVGWQAEGIAFYSGGPTNVFRLYNPNAVAGAHHYTPSTAEKDQLVQLGWQAEGIGWESY